MLTYGWEVEEESREWSGEMERRAGEDQSENKIYFKKGLNLIIY